MSDQANLTANPANPADAGSWRACGLRLAAGSRTLVEALSLAFGPGELWCIAGPNGAGKTTLISVLAGLAEPAVGHVEADGRPLRAWRPEALARRRALMAQTHHDAFAASVFDTVLAHRFPHLGGWGWEREADRAAAREALARLDLAALAARNVLTLSGGERQRVALAGVLCQDAPLLLLDEPLAHLDLHHQAGCLDVLVRWLQDAPRSVIFSCHDLNLARRFATHALLLDGRGGALAGPAREVLTAEAASAAFGYPLLLIERDGHEALVPAWPAQPRRGRAAP
ncbi:ABC transporter ATP-binding protein [Burkholderia plantarii]|uniref:ABC transporter ATP-binding protein n=1 Tax=Burkholderia plantarii TaxID=41899 RepID=UPI0007060835|nr:ABC transporter ATP-binding protein [Burkholderia plantarii]ALK31640.1 ABC-type cobalamin/Fe3+-siderophores transport systems ATPase component [Burkholderia plantarii]GLZ18084.1 ABC transporter ATP-binding protein [Burkholderia plantarii]